MYEDGLCPICHENLGWLAERFWFYGVPADIAHYQHIHNLGLLFPAGRGEWDRIRRIYGWFVKLALTEKEARMIIIERGY